MTIDTSYKSNPGSVAQSGLVDKREMARIVGLGIRSVDNMIAEGMPHLKIGSRRVRFDAQEAIAWLKERYQTRRFKRIAPGSGEPTSGRWTDRREMPSTH